MKKRILAMVLMAALLLTALTACSGTTIKMATGGTTGTYYSYGGVISQVLSGKMSDVKFDVQSTGASKANIYLVSDGEVDIALVQNDVMSYAHSGTDLFAGEVIDNFSAMAGLYAEVCQVISSTDINNIAELKGKRVSVGDAGSGVEFNTRQILAAYGITFDDIIVQNLSFADSATAFKDGKIDAFFCTAGAPTTAIVELTTSKKINILEIDDEHADALIASYPFYTKFSIPGGSYSDIPADVQTVAVTATFIVSNKLSEDIVYRMTKNLFENAADVAVAHAKGLELDPAYAVSGISIPIHPGADKYFKEVGVR